MQKDKKHVLLCDCGGSMPFGQKKDLSHELCRADIEIFRQALSQNKSILVACRQEMAIFEELKEEINPDCQVSYTDIRDRALWSDEAVNAMPKLAALLAEATIEIPPIPAVNMESSGKLLILGNNDAALQAARQLADNLEVTLLLEPKSEIDIGSQNDIPIATGKVRSAKGHLGAYEVLVDGYASHTPSGRGGINFGKAKNEITLTADIVLDLTGAEPLFLDHWRKDGYLRPDPKAPALVQKAIFDASILLGSFEKPRFINVRPKLCAYERNSQPGCRKCLDVCPSGAAYPLDGAVLVDPYICVGCGSCSAACPTGALSYQLPNWDVGTARLQSLLSTYQENGGDNPVLLFHEEEGFEILAMNARYGKGLPARVLPLVLNEVTQLSMIHLLVALGLGVNRMVVLLPKRKREEAVGLYRQIEILTGITQALGHGDQRVIILDAESPDQLAKALYDLPLLPLIKAGNFLAIGDRFGVQRKALKHLHNIAPIKVDEISLPIFAPFAKFELNREKCTLCMACTQACPVKALTANTERPQLSFTENLCINCGLCRSTCPEGAVNLVPGLSFREEAQHSQILKEEEPAICIQCGTPFGIAGVIEKMAANLAGKHSMFMGDAARKLRMCSDCRVIVQFAEQEEPMTGISARKNPRTTDDYKC